MDKSKRSSNEVSKNDVREALTLLFSILAFGLLVLMIYLCNLVLHHPDKLRQFEQRIESLIEPYIPLLLTVTDIMVTSFILVMVALVFFCVYTIWKGRHYLPDVLEGDDK